MQKNNPVTFYTYALSPFGMKVYWALIYKSIAFEQVYVSLNQSQIAFTQQAKVPVLKISEHWKQDSTAACMWLDELFPENSFFADNKEDKQKIIEADRWVTDNLIGAFFRLMIDPKMLWARFHNGRILAKVLDKTSGGVPPGGQFIWGFMGSRTDWVRHHARHMMHYPSVDEMNQGLIADMEKMLGSTGYLAGTDRLSFADLAAYAQIVIDQPLAFKARPDFLGSSSIANWLARVQSQLPTVNTPALVPGLQFERYT